MVDNETSKIFLGILVAQFITQLKLKILYLEQKQIQQQQARLVSSQAYTSQTTTRRQPKCHQLMKGHPSRERCPDPK